MATKISTGLRIQKKPLRNLVSNYEMGIVSQEKAAEVAGLSRADFIFSLARFEVSPFQYTVEEIENELVDQVFRKAGE